MSSAQVQSGAVPPLSASNSSSVGVGSTNAGAVNANPAGGGASSAGGVVTNSAKKGLAMYRFPGSSAAQVGATWYYNWTPAPFAGSSGNAEFVAMINGRDRYDASTFAAIQSSSAKVLLGFNEPDYSAQANMSVAQAIAAWPQFVATGLRLGSPAISSNEQWLADFMSQAQAKNYRVDFIAIHHYPDATSPTAVADFQTWLTALHNTYNLPIWLTEFGISDCGNYNSCAGGALTQAVASKFVADMLTMLDGLPFVERYAWFADAPTSGYSSSNVFDGSGQLTATGQAFAAAGN